VYALLDFDLEMVLTIFLPYHQTPFFLRLVEGAVKGKLENSVFAFLGNFPESESLVTREVIVSEVLRRPQFLDYVVKCAKWGVKFGGEYAGLWGFFTHVMVTVEQTIAHRTLSKQITDSCMFCFFFFGFCVFD